MIDGRGNAQKEPWRRTRQARANADPPQFKSYERNPWSYLSDHFPLMRSECFISMKGRIHALKYEIARRVFNTMRIIFRGLAASRQVKHNFRTSSRMRRSLDEKGIPAQLEAAVL